MTPFRNNKFLFVSFLIAIVVAFFFLNNLTIYYDTALHAKGDIGNKAKVSNSFLTKYFDFKNNFINTNDLSDLDNLNLIIDPSIFYEEMNSDLPMSGREFENAKLSINGKYPINVKVKYRGDTPHHWLFRKKSIRIKIDKSETKKIFANEIVELINPKGPKFMGDYLSMLIANKLDLIVPQYRFVNFFINNKFEGLFQLSENIDTPEFLEKHNLPIGSIFKEENSDFSRAEYLTRMFESPFLWQNKIDHPKKPDHFEKLYDLLTAINKEDLKMVYQLIDYDYFVRMSAFLYLIQSTHYDDAHNVKLYFNDNINKFQQVIWDPGYMSSYSTRDRFITKSFDEENFSNFMSDVIFYLLKNKLENLTGIKYGGKLFASNAMTTFLYRDPRFVNDMYKEAYRLIQAGFLDDLEGKMNDMHDKILPSRKKDVFNDFTINEFEYDLYKIKNELEFMRQLNKRLDDIDICFTTDADSINIAISGEAAFYIKNINGIADETLLDKLLFPGMKLNQGSWPNTKYLTPAALYYSYSYKNAGKINNIKFQNSITGNEIEIEKTDFCNIPKSTYSLDPYLLNF